MQGRIMRSISRGEAFTRAADQALSGGLRRAHGRWVASAGTSRRRGPHHIRGRQDDRERGRSGLGSPGRDNSIQRGRARRPNSPSDSGRRIMPPAQVERCSAAAALTKPDACAPVTAARSPPGENNIGRRQAAAARADVFSGCLGQRRRTAAAPPPVFKRRPCCGNRKQLEREGAGNC